MILAGDIGGTKSNLGLFDTQSGSLSRVAHKRYSSHENPGLKEIVQDFLRETKAQVTAASFGVAGPVVNNCVHGTNMPWIVDGAEAAAFLGLQRVRILNDLEATAFGVRVLPPSDLETIYAGVPLADATCVVIAAGTGLGEAILFWDGKQHLAMGTEGGHADFAPHTEQQADLWKFLWTRGQGVNAEQILGPRFQGRTPVSGARCEASRLRRSRDRCGSAHHRTRALGRMPCLRGCAEFME